MTGPNWRSLITPAVLPLETDFQSLPPEQWVGEKAKKYTENHYTCWLPEGMEEKCVEMMIAQRIAQDYQIAPFTTQAKMSSTRGRINNKKWQDKVGGNMSGASQTICVLSMGHREHKFERESQNEMKVYYRNYVPTTNKQEHNNGDNKGDNKVDQKKKEEHTYTYSLWLSNSDGATSKSNVQGTFVTQTQTFSGDRFQTIWNHLDEVIAGELPAKHVMNEIKWRIVLFAIIPDFSIETDDHLRRFDKFEEFLNSKRDDSSEELTAVRSRLGSGMSTTRGATENGVGPVREPQILRVSLDKDDPWEWVALECDGEIDVDAKRCYKFAVRWLLCSGWVVDEFLTSLSRKAKQIGIKLVQIPHYSRELDVHPFVAHALLVKASTDRVRYLVEGALVERYGFVLYVMSESKEKVARKRKFHSRQESSGTKTDVSQLTSNLDIKPKTRDPDTHQQPFPTKSTFLRQYIHSSGSAFIRVYEDGTFGWVKNRLRNPYASIKVTSYDSHDNILREIREHAAILGLIDSLLSNIIDNVQEM